MDDLELLDAIHDALERDPAEALVLAREGLARDEEASELLFLCGVALLELDQPDAAAAELRRALALSPEDPEFRAWLALALFRAGDFATAGAEVAAAAAAAAAADEQVADVHVVQALLAERRGETDAADAAWERAAAVDPERFPIPVRMTRDEFREEIEQAAALLPEQFRRHLDEVLVTVQPVPADELLGGADDGADPELLGLFVGRPLGDSGEMPEMPPAIFLFQRNLERACTDRQELRQEIAVTLYHELGHYLGIEEDGMDELGLA